MKQAMIFAAGLGTRLKPLTDTMPKALVPVNGRPLLEHILLKLKASGYERVVINVHHFADQIIDYVARHADMGLDIRISDERSALLETGGGLKHARPLFDADAPILIHNVDILSDADLHALWQQACEQRSAVLAISRRESASGRYLLFAEDQRLVGWTNTRTGEVRSPYPDALQQSRLQAPFAGIHAFHPDLFPLMDAWPDRFSIIDFYLDICREHPVCGHLADFRLMDVGKLDSLAQADAFARELDSHTS